MFTVRKTVASSRQIVVYAKNYTLRWRKDAQKYHTRYIQVYDRAIQRIARIERFKVHLPKEELYKEYEARVEPYKREIRQQIKTMEKEERSYQWYLEDFFANKTSMIKTSQKLGFKRHVYADELSESYGVTHRKAQTIARLINEKLEEGVKNGSPNS